MKTILNKIWYEIKTFIKIIYFLIIFSSPVMLMGLLLIPCEWSSELEEFFFGTGIACEVEIFKSTGGEKND